MILRFVGACESPMRVILILITVLFSLPCLLAQFQPVIPAGGPGADGPYSPGLWAGDYLYVSGLGPRNPDGRIPDGFEAQARQVLENTKAVVEAAGLTMEHVVYTHVYLRDMADYESMNSIYGGYFPKAPPARAVLGIAGLRDGARIDLKAVAVRHPYQKMPVQIPGFDPGEPYSPGIVTHDQVYVSAMLGRDRSSGRVPDDPAEQVQLALDGMNQVLQAAGLDLRHMVFVNPFLTKQLSAGVMNEVYARHWAFGTAPGRGTIFVVSLPHQAQIEYTGVAVRDLAKRVVVYPKNFKTSATASPCVLGGEFMYCSGKSGFITGVNGGIFSPDVGIQLRQSMRNLLDGLEEAGMDFTNTVATTLYVDNIEEYAPATSIYKLYFRGPPPAQAALQQIPSVERKEGREGRWPGIEQLTLIAYKPQSE
jgi:reactive intermediate/imine deaminase